jgi:hypothetical protein
MNPWKISTFVLGLAVVGLIGLSASGGSSLQGAFGSASSSTIDTMSQIISVHNELGYSTWTLEDLAVAMEAKTASIVYRIGYDTDAIATQVTAVQDQLGTSSWTLEKLATHIQNTCN